MDSWRKLYTSCPILKLKNLMEILKYILLFCLLIFGCSNPKQYSYNIDTDKDTSFIVERSSGNPSIRVSVDGYLAHDANIVINYYESKVDTNTKFYIPLFAGKIELKEVPWDFYADKARVTFKHQENKKGKIIIKAIL
jgi:hypothetical protein